MEGLKIVKSLLLTIAVCLFASIIGGIVWTLCDAGRFKEVISGGAIALFIVLWHTIYKEV